MRAPSSGPWGPPAQAHFKLGGDEDGSGADELQLVPHGGHLHQVVVQQLDRQVQCLMGELKVLLQKPNRAEAESGLWATELETLPETGPGTACSYPPLFLHRAMSRTRG